MRVGLVAVAAVLAAGLLSGCGGAGDTTEGAGKGAGAVASSPAVKESAAPAKVVIRKAGFEDHEVWGPHAYVVHWELTNTGKAAGNFYAGIDFLDADGDVLGSTGITADKLGPGKTARGDSAPLPAEIGNGTIADIRGARVTEVERLEP
ncbi:hypothetical protein OG234_13475 [Streptomyces sp. NBC_01420]|uniref:hypothetical protein n=1 Tax=Streptomyces sp. NBC_01420 TaxID=2903858 RepID=UPI003243077E